MKVFINPGHDTEKDPGAVNLRTGLQEAKVAYEVGEKVKNILMGIGYDTYLLQDDNLSGVIQKANNWGADLFISIHCNSVANPSANGTETLFYPSSSKGKHLANCLQKQMIQEFNLTDRGIKERTDLGVLKQTKMPSALCEMAFISNVNEERLLKNNTQHWANAIARGVTDYIALNQ